MTSKVGVSMEVFGEGYRGVEDIAMRQMASINSVLSTFSGRPESEVAFPVTFLRVGSSSASNFLFRSSLNFL